MHSRIVAPVVLGSLVGYAACSLLRQSAVAPFAHHPSALLIPLLAAQCPQSCCVDGHTPLWCCETPGRESKLLQGTIYVLKVLIAMIVALLAPPLLRRRRPSKHVTMTKHARMPCAVQVGLITPKPCQSDRTPCQQRPRKHSKEHLGVLLPPYTGSPGP